MTLPNQLPEFTIGLKTKVKVEELYSIRTSEDVAKIARLCFDADMIEWVESVVVIALNRAGKAIGFYKASQGGLTGTVCDPRVIMQFALLSNATSIIIAHNHPSGNLRPSDDDNKMTQRIKNAGDILEIKLLDHVIITANSFYSYADNGTL